MDELARIDEMIGALARMTDVQDKLDFRDKAHGVQVIAKRRKRRKLANKAAEAVIRAEISIGQDLAEMDELRPGNPHGNTSPLEALGITQKQSFNWQRMAEQYDDSPNKWETIIAKFLADEDAELTKSALMRAVWSGVLDSRSYEWWTPKEYIDAVHDVMGGIDLDPASNAKANETVRARKFHDSSVQNNGLSFEWKGRVFLNPPYGKLGREFIEKLYESLGAVTEAIVLVNSNSADTEWFQPLFEGVMCFTDHRIDFVSPDNHEQSSTHGSCFVYYGPNKDKFAQAFSRFGNVVKRWP